MSQSGSQRSTPAKRMKLFQTTCNFSPGNHSVTTPNQSSEDIEARNWVNSVINEVESISVEPSLHPNSSYHQFLVKNDTNENLGFATDKERADYYQKRYEESNIERRLIVFHLVQRLQELERPIVQPTWTDKRWKVILFSALISFSK
jgi:hypothetical protein